MTTKDFTRGAASGGGRKFRIPIRIAALSGVAVRIAARLGTKLHMSNESLLIISGVGYFWNSSPNGAESRIRGSQI